MTPMVSMVVQVECCDCHASRGILQLDLLPVDIPANMAGISNSCLILILSKILSNTGPLHILVDNSQRSADPPVPDMCEESLRNLGMLALYGASVQ